MSRNIAGFFNAAERGRGRSQRASHGFRLSAGNDTGRGATSRTAGPSPTAVSGVPVTLSSSSSSSSQLAGPGSRAGGGGASAAHSPQSDGGYHWSTGPPPVSAADVASGIYHAPAGAPGRGYSLAVVNARAALLEAAEAERRAKGPAAAAEPHKARALAIAFGGGGGSDGAGARRSQPRNSLDISSNNNNNDDDDDELTVSAVEFSLLCPYSRLPIRVPVRSRQCAHVQCCDLDSWMVVLDRGRALRDPTGACPVCERRVAASTLEVDLWMAAVMERHPPGTHLVVLEADGQTRSGDTTRERRREEAAVEVDATQADYESTLADIIVDDDDDEAAAQLPPPLAQDYPHPHPPLSGVGQRRGRDAEGAGEGPGGGGGVANAPPAARVKQETADEAAELAATAAVAAATAAAGGTPSPPQPSPSAAASESEEDSGVVMVSFAGSTRRGAGVLPSQVRLWLPHCPTCRAGVYKGEDGAGVERCPGCGSGREEWSHVRRFAADPRVTIELLRDGTVIIAGADAAARYWARAGFTRSLGPPSPSAAAAGIWVSGLPHTRTELDFIEGVCDRVARLSSGEEGANGGGGGGAPRDAASVAQQLQASFNWMMVPPCFRAPRSYQAGQQQQQQQQRQSQYPTFSQTVANNTQSSRGSSSSFGGRPASGGGGTPPIRRTYSVAQFFNLTQNAAANNSNNNSYNNA